MGARWVGVDTRGYECRSVSPKTQGIFVDVRQLDLHMQLQSVRVHLVVVVDVHNNRVRAVLVRNDRKIPARSIS